MPPMTSAACCVMLDLPSCRGQAPTGRADRPVMGACERRLLCSHSRPFRSRAETERAPPTGRQIPRKDTRSGNSRVRPPGGAWRHLHGEVVSCASSLATPTPLAARSVCRFFASLPKAWRLAWRIMPVWPGVDLAFTKADAIQRVAHPRYGRSRTSQESKQRTRRSGSSTRSAPLASTPEAIPATEPSSACTTTLRLRR